MGKKLRVLFPVLALLFLMCSCVNNRTYGGSTVTIGRGDGYYGQLTIPAVGLDVALSCDSCPSCCTVLYNGGRILADDAHLFADVKIGDLAYVNSEIDGLMVLECVEIVDCLQKFCAENGDVLMYARPGWWPMVRVYRWIIL